MASNTVRSRGWLVLVLLVIGILVGGAGRLPAEDGLLPSDAEETTCEGTSSPCPSADDSRPTSCGGLAGTPGECGSECQAACGGESATSCGGTVGKEEILAVFQKILEVVERLIGLIESLISQFSGAAGKEDGKTATAATAGDASQADDGEQDGNDPSDDAADVDEDEAGAAKTGEQGSSSVAGATSADSPSTGAETPDKGSPSTPAAIHSFFLFASPSDETGRPQGVRPEEINVAIRNQCHGNPKELLVGFDISGLSARDLQALAAGKPGSIENPGLRLAAAKGCGLHAYVEGPGGETGSRWAADEKARIIQSAKQVGITIKDPSNPRDPGTIAWNQRGWREYTHRQLASLKKAGFQTAEIDNLPNDKRVGDDENGAGTVAFYQEYAQWWKRGEVPRLAPKNLSVPQWKAVVAAVSSGTLPRGMFADFSIAEEGIDDRQAGAQVASRIGITGLMSNDTENYATSGKIRPAKK
ncbi:MAG: hypothetical protein GX442_14235 [Candidatus Riflebacteria bacterium]|nr:hypothetical protein [Candidatus Riflebacteria bacterium]